MIESVFLWVPPAIAITDLIVNGTLARHPALRIGIVELSSVWVPQYLMMLDGGWEFTTALNGGPLAPLDLRPSEYFRRQVRVSSFSYEQPARLTAKAGDLFMCCSDFPHSEGTATPVEDYGRVGAAPGGVPRPLPRQRRHPSFVLGPRLRLPGTTPPTGCPTVVHTVIHRETPAFPSCYPQARQVKVEALARSLGQRQPNDRPPGGNSHTYPIEASAPGGSGVDRGHPARVRRPVG